MGTIENINDHRKKSGEISIDIIPGAMALAGGLAAFRITKAAYTSICKTYGIPTFGVGILSYAIAGKVTSTLYRDARCFYKGFIEGINRIKEGEDHGRSETGRYQTEQPQE